jgi:pyruvate kinase
MVARGDLGVELPLEEVPVIQKHIIAAANRRGVLAITATQMLESMTDSHRPTRAEASDVANAVFDGTDAVMLSGETAVGRDPVAAVSIMSRIVEAAEASVRTVRPIRERAEPDQALSFTDAIGHAASAASEDVRAKAIAAFTQSGFTAGLISKYRPRVPIMAFTPHERVLRRLCLFWGTEPRLVDLVGETDRMVDKVEALLLADGTVRAGDSVVILSGAPIAARGSTNMLKLHRVGDAT